jgi:hypothetical protein
MRTSKGCGMAEADVETAILDRIASGSLSDRELKALRALGVHGNDNVVQVGKYNVPIESGRDIYIGDRVYTGTDAEALRRVLLDVVHEQSRLRGLSDVLISRSASCCASAVWARSSTPCSPSTAATRRPDLHPSSGRVRHLLRRVRHRRHRLARAGLEPQGARTMIDPVSLSAELARFLLPFLPALVRAGGTVVDTVADATAARLGKEAQARLAALWRRLWPRVERSPSVQEAVEDAASHPEDARREAALSLSLEKLLAADPAFAEEIAELLQSARTVNLAGRDVITVQGDDNEVQVGEYNVSIRRARDVTMEARDRRRP